MYRAAAPNCFRASSDMRRSRVRNCSISRGPSVAKSYTLGHCRPYSEAVSFF
jgi:hypothetical protein